MYVVCTVLTIQYYCSWMEAHQSYGVLASWHMCNLVSDNKPIIDEITQISYFMNDTSNYNNMYTMRGRKSFQRKRA